MIDDFMRVLARIQSDYGFYIDCQTNPGVALRDYALNTVEDEALRDPEKLRAMLEDSAHENTPMRLVISFSGKHDWVNRTRVAPPRKKNDAIEHNAQVSREVVAIRQAGTHGERAAAALRLLAVME